VLEKNEIISPVLERKLFTSDEVHRMMAIGILPEESGWELINGEIIHRMTIGSKHAGTVKRINLVLTKLLADDFIIGVQDPIQINQRNEPEPDISILKMRDDFYVEKHPQASDILLVVEVSDSTLKFDRETKKRIYSNAGIVEYWLVDLEENTLETYSKPKSGTYFEMKVYERGDVVYSKHIEKLKLNVSEIIPEIKK
ncbi:MAG: Uma2 family endonuclease, partial [Aridibacter sp.]